VGGRQILPHLTMLCPALKEYIGAAMEEEIGDLTEMGTRSHVPLPTGRKAIPCKWVFKRQLNADGSLDRYRARLVRKGFQQRYSGDYDKVFAPVVRMSTAGLFFSIVSSYDLE
jgi:hypothetical protein